VHDLNSLNAHFQHHLLIPADLSSPNVFAVEVTATHEYSGCLIFSVGCHSGLNVPDDPANAQHTTDWSQSFLREGATFIGNSGYGYGDSDLVAYSERLMVNFVEELGYWENNEPQTVGRALLRAKQRYYNTASGGALSNYDEKVMGEMMLYGLPMLQVRMPVTTTTAPGGETSGISTTQRAITTKRTLANGFEEGVIWSNHNLGFEYVSRTLGALGSYYAIAGEGDMHIAGARPVHPRTNLDVHITGTIAHGALMVGGSFVDELSFDPFVSRIVTERLYIETEPAYPAEMWYPARVGTINCFLSIDRGFRERLVVVPGQFRVAAGATTTGTQRLYSDLQYQVYHAPYTVTDFIAPSIWQVEAISTSLFLRLRVRVDDDAGDVARVVVLYRGEDDTSWAKAELPYNAASGLAETFLAPVARPIYYFAQAVDSAGNVALALDHGNPFAGPEDGDLWDASLPRSLTTELTVNRDTLAEGEVTTYTVVVNNTGWGMISSGLVSATLPEGLALIGPVTIEPADAGTVGTLPALAHGLVITPLQAITITFPVRALDGPARITSTVAVTSARARTPAIGKVVITVTNAPPVATDDDYEANEDETLVVTGTDGLLSNDMDVPSDTLAVVSYASPACGMVTLTTSGAFTYTPKANFFGIDAFTYTVSDGDDGVTASVHITVAGVNDPPVVTNPGAQINTVGDIVSRTIEASDVESDLLTYSASGLPPGLSINPTEGLISGTCGISSVGGYSVTVEVSDSISTTNVTFGWTIISPGGQIYLPLVVRNYVSAFDLRHLPVGNGF
jgi:uncharacterized repeat protein (TIGR01451 family)